MHALVVDDARAVRRVLRRSLEEIGIEVSEAADGVEALETLGADTEINLAIVDWNMPRMSGIEFVRRLRALSDHQECRVLMVTTEAMEEQVLEALSAGADEYLMKPFTREAFYEKLALVGVCLSPSNETEISQ
jgi:two-component system chemotaxis response regulator CheY